LADRAAFRRVLLKLSGEALMGGDPYGINRAVIDRIAAELKTVVATGVQLAIVVGGGNIFRGIAPAAAGVARSPSPKIAAIRTLFICLDPLLSPTVGNVLPR